MRILSLSLAAVLALSAVAPAFAADRITDGQLIRASRCLGLATSENLGPYDATALQALVKTESRSRESLIRDRANTAQQKASSQARKAKDELKASLIAERDGVCKALVDASAGA
jgi:hypothetical protein